MRSNFHLDEEENTSNAQILYYFKIRPRATNIFSLLGRIDFLFIQNIVFFFKFYVRKKTILFKLYCYNIFFMLNVFNYKNIYLFEAEIKIYIKNEILY